MSAQEPQYRLKLYGHIASDVDRFVRKTAVLLRLSPGDVQRLMLALPVELKKNLGRDAAESLKMQLDALGALTMVEPMQEVVEETLPLRSPHQVSIRDGLREFWNRGDADPEARIYLALLIGATLLLSSIITIGYSASLVKLFRQEAPIASRESTRYSGGASRTGFATDRLGPTQLAEIDSRINELDTQIETLQFQYGEADRILRRVNSSTSANRSELFERSREVADLRNKIREAHSELMELRRIRDRPQG